VSVANVAQVRHVAISDCRIYQSTALGYSFMAYQVLWSSVYLAKKLKWENAQTDSTMIWSGISFFSW